MAWSGDLNPDMQIDISLKTLVGRGIGESLQMAFREGGFAVVPPYVEMYLQGALQ